MKRTTWLIKPRLIPSHGLTSLSGPWVLRCFHWNPLCYKYLEHVSNLKTSYKTWSLLPCESFCISPVSEILERLRAQSSCLLLICTKCCIIPISTREQFVNLWRVFINLKYLYAFLPCQAILYYINHLQHIASSVVL